MNYFILYTVLIVSVTHILCDECSGADNKVIFNFVVSKQVAQFANQLRLFNKTYINMSKDKFEIGSDIEADGVKLFNLYDLIAGPTYMQTCPGNMTYADIKIGLENMLLNISKLKYKNKEYNNASVTVTNVFLSTTQKIKYAYDSCNETYVQNEISPVAKAVLNNDVDVTEDMNNIVVPWVNKQLARKEFTALADKYFNNLCDVEATINLQNLITSPYSD